MTQVFQTTVTLVCPHDDCPYLDPYLVPEVRDRRHWDARATSHLGGTFIEHRGSRCPECGKEGVPAD